MTFLAKFYGAYGNIVDLCLLNGILAYGVYLALSANMFTLGTGGFMAVGAYCAVYLTMQLQAPFAIAVVAGGALAALAAAAIGAPVLRLRGDYFMLATFSFTEVVRVIALNWESVTGGATGIVAIPDYTSTPALAALLLVTVALVYALRRSRHGRAIDAIRHDDTIAEAMGVNVFRYRMALFVASGFISGVCGGLAAHLNFFIGPTDFGLLRSVDALASPILGGVNALLGPVTGAVITTVLPEALRFSNQLREILMGALILVAALYLPGGAASLFRRRRPGAPAPSSPLAKILLAGATR